MSAAKKSVFVSHTGKDRAWAEWIAWQLEASGQYVCTLDTWDFTAGKNWVAEMDRAVQTADLTLAVLSTAYQAARYTPPEWWATFARDPQAKTRRLVPVRIEDCDVVGLLGQISYADLFGLGEREARERLLAAAGGTRAKPSDAPSFPGGKPFPGAPRGPRRALSILHVGGLGIDNGEVWLERFRRELASLHHPVDLLAVTGDMAATAGELGGVEVFLRGLAADLSLPPTRLLLAPGPVDADAEFATMLRRKKQPAWPEWGALLGRLGITDPIGADLMLARRLDAAPVAVVALNTALGLDDAQAADAERALAGDVLRIVVSPFETAVRADVHVSSLPGPGWQLLDLDERSARWTRRVWDGSAFIDAGTGTLAIRWPVQRDREERRDEPRDPLVEAVMEACRFRFPPDPVVELREHAGLPWLRVRVDGAAVVETHAVAVTHTLDVATVDTFRRTVVEPLRAADPGAQAHVVSPTEGEPTAREAARAAGITAWTTRTWRGFVDFRAYVGRLRERLDHDVLYPADLYVPQRMRVAEPGQVEVEAGEIMVDALAQVRDWLEASNGRLVLLLGDFGVGKTFLLRRLARAYADSDVIPALIDLRGLDKSLTLDQLLAAHFAREDLPGFTVAGLRHLVRRGDVALLFDGFDELYTRVGYDQSVAHLDTLLGAMEGRARVVIASRRQHFRSARQVGTKLYEQAERIASLRVGLVEGFTEDQVRAFLIRKLGTVEAADKRLDLLRLVHDLHGLAHNPRMLSFLVDIDERELRRHIDERLSAADLYQLLIDQWMDHEQKRIGQKGAAKPVPTERMMAALTSLACRMWGSGAPAAYREELSEEAGAVLTGLQVLQEHATHQLGASTLLVRDGDGGFRFVHRSVLEWLVARDAAAKVKDGKGPDALAGTELTALMVEFFADLSGDAGVGWARGVVKAGGPAAVNGERVLARRGVRAEGANLAGQDLSGQDLSGRDLRQADLSGAKLVGANLDAADLRYADLRGADLTDAHLEGADLRGANLEGAVGRRAWFFRARFDGAKVEGADFGRAVLVGVELPSGARVDNAALSGSLVPTLPGDRAAVNAVAWSPDGELVAAGLESGIIELWDQEAGSLLWRATGHAGYVSSLAFAGDGRSIASAANDASVRLWAPTSGVLQRTLHGHTANVLSVAFAPGGRVLASASEDSSIRLWDPNSGELWHTLLADRDWVRAVAFGSDGRTVASAHHDTTVRLRDLSSGRLKHTLAGHAECVRAVALAPDGRSLASGSDDRAVRLWDTAHGEQRCSLDGHADWVMSVTYAPDGRTLASASDDGGVRLWDADSGALRRALVGHGTSVREVAFAPDGRTLASASWDRSVRIWDADSGELRRTLEGHTSTVTAFAFATDGRTLASASDDNAVRLWDPDSGALRRTLQGHTSLVTAVAFAADQRTLASASYDNSVRLWDPSSGALRRTLQGHSQPVNGVVFTADGCTLASGSSDNSVRLWDPDSGTLRRTLEGHTHWVMAVAFATDGRTLASASRDNTVRLWDPNSPRPSLTVLAHSASVTAVAFTPDGRTLASASHDKSVRLWDPDSGILRRTLQAHTAPVTAIAFSPTGQILASASDDNTVRLWDPTTGTVLHTLTTGRATSVAFTPDGLHLVASNTSGHLTVWRVADGTLLGTMMAWDDSTLLVTPDGRWRGTGDAARVFAYRMGLVRLTPEQAEHLTGTRLRLPDDFRLY